MVVIAAIAFIIIGLLALFARDMVWELTVFGNQWEGQASERSELWEMKTIFGGILSLGLGIVVLLMFIFS
jgi:hypothetical protein